MTAVFVTVFDGDFFYEAVNEEHIQRKSPQISSTCFSLRSTVLQPGHRRVPAPEQHHIWVSRRLDARTVDGTSVGDDQEPDGKGEAKEEEEPRGGDH